MRYSIGIDFGTGSGRVLILDTESGNIVGKHIVKYRSNVEQNLINKEIPHTFSLQNAADYMEVLVEGIPRAMREAKINKNQIIGLGIAFTSSTSVVADKYLNPLNFQKRFENNPHAYVKLWKHHGASNEAENMYKIAQANNNNWIKNYGFNVSSEWLIPKVLELKNSSPEVLKEATYIMEGGDWIVSCLINENVRSNCARGFKAFWNEKEGFSYDFFEKTDTNLPKIVQEKLEGRLVKIGEQAGIIAPNMSEKLNLPKNLPVAPAIIDAHSSLLGIGSIKKKQLTMVMGTSICHLMLHDQQKSIPGISGSVKDAIAPKLFAYEAGQSAVGDLFEHVIERIPKSYSEDAVKRNISVYQLLEEKAAAKKPGETGVISLDWHNGNRSVLSNSDLSGVLVGLTLKTKIEDIYRAYMESTAFSAKKIIETYEKWGMQIDTIFAAGGLPQKNNLLMQIYADVLNRPIQISSSDYASGIGAAILGSVSGGAHSTIEDAVNYMKQPILKTIFPKYENVVIYKKIYEIYKELHDFYGIKQVSIMEQLKKLKNLIDNYE